MPVELLSFAVATEKQMLSASGTMLAEISSHSSNGLDPQAKEGWWRSYYCLT